MAEASTPVDDKKESLLQTLNCNGSISSSANGKKHRIGSLDDSETLTYNSSASSLGHSNSSAKMAKRELPSDSLSSPNSTFKGKRRQRNYRPRIMESSSEDESIALPNDSNKDNSEVSATSDAQNLVSNDLTGQNNKASSDTPVNCEALNNSSKSLDTTNMDQSEDQDQNCSSLLSSASTRNLEDQSTSTVKMETEEEASAPRASESGTSTNTGSRGANSDSGATPAGGRNLRHFLNFPLESDSEDTNEDEESEDAERRERTEDRAKQCKKLKESVARELNTIMGKRKPKHNWNALQAVLNRQYGMPANRQSAVLFTNRYYDSLHVVQRLKQVSVLDFHNGCANALNFNESGELLASSSDDLQIAVWDWTKEKTLITYNSGHRNNVFQCKFLPLSGNTHIASCARDGQVRLAELSATGVCKGTRRLAKHSRSAHKLAVRINTPYELMSVGEDALVYNIDIRIDQPDKIVLVKDVHGSRVPLYSINQHPLNDDQFCVSGQDEHVRVYDRRIISPFGPPVLKYCPNHLLDKKPKSHITCAVYSNNGDAILASYNDEDIYLFDTSLSEGMEPIHKYSGHRNSSTVKGVNFFSPSSRFVVSGSDCGNIFIWDRETEAIVNCMPGDVNGVVNVLEPHPHFPILATSGLDNEIKIWVPSQEEDPKLTNLQKTVRSNVLRRLRDNSEDNQGVDAHMLMLLFQHLRRNSSIWSPRGGASQASNTNDDDDDDFGMLDSSDSSSDDNSDSDDSDPPNRSDVVQCSTH